MGPVIGQAPSSETALGRLADVGIGYSAGAAAARFLYPLAIIVRGVRSGTHGSRIWIDQWQLFTLL